jgi:hypothetical protein
MSQVLEGGQSTSFLLLLATSLTYSAMLPYCFQPGTIDCIIRSIMLYILVPRVDFLAWKPSAEIQILHFL